MKKIKFYKNSRDGSHCMQACIKMVLNKFLKEKISFKEIDTFTGFRKGGYSFFPSTINFLLSKNLGCLYIDSFDYAKFAEKGKSYMGENIDDDTFVDFDKNVDLDFEQKMMALNLKDKNFSFEKRIPSLDEMRNAIAQEKIIIVSINPNQLNLKDQYGSHSVIILSINEREVIFHDPGNPPIPNFKVERSLFEKAFYEDDPRVANCLIISKS